MEEIFGYGLGTIVVRAQPRAEKMRMHTMGERGRDAKRITAMHCAI